MALTIVLGYDGSECAKEALGAAVDLARGQLDSRIVVVHGREVDLVVGGGPMAAELIVPQFEDVEPPAEAGISTWLDEATARIAAAGVAVESELKRESASTAVLVVPHRH